jgi:uncharacterized protein (DUF2141 family)
MRAITMFLAPVAMAAAVAVQAGAATLSVSLTNSAPDVYTVRVALFSSAAAFLTESNAFRRAKAPPVNGAATVVFTDLPTGVYAIAAYHDLDGNELLDTNFVGKPVEPYGFSNNIRHWFGPASFAEASFAVTSMAAAIHIRLE